MRDFRAVAQTLSFRFAHEPGKDGVDQSNGASYVLIYLLLDYYRRGPSSFGLPRGRV